MRSGTSWGRWPLPSHRSEIALHDRRQRLPQAVGTVLPWGNGRSYGDSCQNAGGTLVATRGLDRFIAFDATTGLLHCEAGATLGEILALTVPRGWFLPVTPGTQFATAGGALANDVHGKNHHLRGSFGDHVRSFTLVRSDGTRQSVVRGEPLFAATTGGLGLTGLVTDLELQLMPVSGPWMTVESIRFGNVREFFRLSAESSAAFDYTVAWVDCAAKGKNLGRGHFLRARHAPAGSAGAAPGRPYPMPLMPPFSLVNGLSLRAFNALYFHRQRSERAVSTQHFQPYFYPLDGIYNWNRMYGPKGFLQHQCVLPPATAHDAIPALMREIATSGQGSFLAVLKEFGDRAAPGLLSFARPGTTLALDFPRSAKALELLSRLDAIVAEAGGALYPAKDARMSPAMFKASFPRLAEFLPHIDPAFSSSFWRRVMETP